MEPDLPADPWALFGLDPAQATERQIKASYAKLLKRYRPDQFPAEFQRIREAYDFCLEQLPFYRDLPEPGSVPPPAVPQLPTDAFETLTRELHSLLTNSGNLASQQQLFQKLFQEIPNVPNGPERWQSMMEHVFDDRTGSLASLMQSEQMLTLLHLEDTATFCTVLGEWKRQNDLARLLALYKCVAQHRYKPQSPGTAVALARFASYLAVHRPEMAHRLLNLAFPLLPVVHRAKLTSVVENRIGIGKTLNGMPTPHQTFWEQRLFDRDATVDWEAPAAQQALNHLRDNYGHGWHGFDLLRPLLPPDELERLQKAEERMRQLRPQEQGTQLRRMKQIALYLILYVGLLFILFGFNFSFAEMLKWFSGPP